MIQILLVLVPFNNSVISNLVVKVSFSVLVLVLVLVLVDYVGVSNLYVVVLFEFIEYVFKVGGKDGDDGVVSVILSYGSILFLYLIFETVLIPTVSSFSSLSSSSSSSSPPSPSLVVVVVPLVTLTISRSSPNLFVVVKSLSQPTNGIRMCGQTIIKIST